MSDYTPTTDELREWYVRRDRTGRSSRKEYEAEFDRWLAQERARAKVQVLRDAIEHIDSCGLSAYATNEVVLWLRDVADYWERES